MQDHKSNVKRKVYGNIVPTSKNWKYTDTYCNNTSQQSGKIRTN